MNMEDILKQKHNFHTENSFLSMFRCSGFWMIKGGNVCLEVLMSVCPKDLENKISQLLLNNTTLLDQFYFFVFFL